jgi:hypothetical protein
MNAIGQSVEAGYFIDEEVLSEVECEQLLDAIAVSPPFVAVVLDRAT